MEELENELKRLIVSSLELPDVDPLRIDSTEPIFGAGLGLDSVEALELAIALKKTYGVSLRAEDEVSREALSSVRQLAHFVNENRTR